ncbi:MAG: hypothetical protein KatS3mg115_0930 [Candidatus Poribacteria bacterium]|nr:MAG: hypothetical protein KatS3mg115_0930 [Candidatus Poribacteria bacterium]
MNQQSAQQTSVRARGKGCGYRLKYEVFAARRALYGIRNAEEIARRGGISVQAVRKVLSGKQPNPQLRTLVAICKALDLRLEDVVEY